MDGFKKRLNDSVQLKLSVSLTLTILVVATVAGIVSFLSAYDEAHELQDDTLRQVAAMFDQRHPPLEHLGDNGRARNSNEEARVIVQYLHDRKAPEKEADEAPLPLATTLPEGLQTLRLDDEPYRVLVKTLDSGQRIAVAQETGLRDAVARASALRTLTPFLVLVPLLLLLVANLVRKMFRPISDLSSDIHGRTELELHPVEIEHLPVEVRPFAVAINALLVRVNRSMEAQRRFIADAAHELRSPLTALSLQAERLSESEMSEQARERLVTLRNGIARGRKLLDQLLALSRAQAATERPAAPVSVMHVYRLVLADLMPLAEARHIDIGIDGKDDVELQIDELDLIGLVRNLVDNAIRYTPEGGKVDLAISTANGWAVIQVRDTGPGIRPSERERVFSPFYRILGTNQTGAGLGLSIVRTVADRIGAEIQMAFTDDNAKSGLCVSICVPGPIYRERIQVTARGAGHSVGTN